MSPACSRRCSVLSHPVVDERADPQTEELLAERKGCALSAREERRHHRGNSAFFQIERLYFVDRQRQGLAGTVTASVS
jgi:hypothetical protein